MLVYWRVRQSFCFSHLPSGTMARKSQVSGLQSPWHLGPGFSRFSPATSSRCSNFYKFHYVPLTQICIVRIYSYISYISILYPLIYPFFNFFIAKSFAPLPPLWRFSWLCSPPRLGSAGPFSTATRDDRGFGWKDPPFFMGTLW